MLGTSSVVVTATLWLLIGFSIAHLDPHRREGPPALAARTPESRVRDAFWAERDLAAAEALAGAHPGPLARVCRAGLGAARPQQDGEHSLQFTGDRRDVIRQACASRSRKNTRHSRAGSRSSPASAAPRRSWGCSARSGAS